jgi:hypothetical protein
MLLAADGKQNLEMAHLLWLVPRFSAADNFFHSKIIRRRTTQSARERLN